MHIQFKTRGVRPVVVLLAALLLTACSGSEPVQDPVPQLPLAPPGDLFEGVWGGIVRSNRTGGEGNALVTFAKADDRHYIMQFGGPEKTTLSVPITVEYNANDTTFNGAVRAKGLRYDIVGRFRGDGSIFAYYTHGDDEGIVKLKRDTLP